jgi:hypothetical protein
MPVKEQLLALETQFWTAGAEFYRSHVDGQCLLAFAEMAGLMSNRQVAATVTDGPRWTDLAVEEVGFLQLADDVALLTYRASARRAGGDPYRAVVSSAYVRRDGAWKLAFHQQTPLQP